MGLPFRVFELGSLRLAITVLILVTAGLIAGPASAKDRSAEVADRVTADVGETAPIYSNRDFRVFGSCEDQGAGSYRANTYLKAKRNNLAFDLYAPGSDTDFDKSDPPVDITGGDAQGADPDFQGAEYYDFYVESQKGIPFNGRVISGVHLKGADCLFAGAFTGGVTKHPVRAVKRVKVAVGKSAPLFQTQDFRLNATCIDNGAGDVAADTRLRARRNHLLYYLTEYDGFDLNFGRGDAPVDVIPSLYEANGLMPSIKGDSFSTDVWMEGQDGKVLQARVTTGVHTRGADCTFSALLVGGRSSKQLRILNRNRVDAGRAAKLFENRDFRVIGRCVDNGGGDLLALPVLIAKRPNLLYTAYDGDPYTDLDLDPADGAQVITQDAAHGTLPSYYAEDDYDDFVVTGRIASGVHVRGADCTFAGIFAR